MSRRRIYGPAPHECYYEITQTPSGRWQWVWHEFYDGAWDTQDRKGGFATEVAALRSVADNAEEGMSPTDAARVARVARSLATRIENRRVATV